MSGFSEGSNIAWISLSVSGASAFFNRCMSSCNAGSLRNVCDRRATPAHVFGSPANISSVCRQSGHASRCPCNCASLAASLSSSVCSTCLSGQRSIFRLLHHSNRRTQSHDDATLRNVNRRQGQPQILRHLLPWPALDRSLPECLPGRGLHLRFHLFRGPGEQALLILAFPFARLAVGRRLTFQ